MSYWKCGYTNIADIAEFKEDDETLTRKEMKKRVTGVKFYVETQLLDEHVTSQQIADFFGSFPNLKSLVLSGIRDEETSLECATIVLNGIPPNSCLEQLVVENTDFEKSTTQKLQDFATALSKHSSSLKILGIHQPMECEFKYFWGVPPDFGPILDCIPTMSLVKLEIGTPMDLFSHWEDKFPQIFQGLQELSIEFVPNCMAFYGGIIGEANKYKSLHIENALQLMEKAVEATTTIHTVSFIIKTEACRAEEDWTNKVGEIRLLNAPAEDVDNFYMRIGSVYKQIETSTKKKENPRPFTVHLSWSDTHINSHKSACKALYDHLKPLSTDSDGGHIPTKEFGLIEALIQAKESPSSVSAETIVSRMFFYLSCDPGLWVNNAIRKEANLLQFNNCLHSLKASGVPFEQAMQQVRDVYYGNKQSNYLGGK